MFYIYILRSESTGRYYCGQTNDLENRVHQHNDPGHRSTKTTKRFTGPWKLIWHHVCETRAEAMSIERQIKKRGIARFLKEQDED